MAANTFDALMTGAGNSLAGVAALIGQQRNQQLMLQDRQEQREANATQFLMQQSEVRRQMDRDTRVADQASLERQAMLNFAREESVFKRMQAGLDHQMKLAESDRKDRDAAFTRTIQLTQAGLQAKMQGLQIKEIERQSLLVDFKSEAGAMIAKFQASAGEDPQGFAEDMRTLMSDPRYTSVAGLDPELQGRILGSIEAAKRMPTGISRIDPGFVPGSTQFDEENITNQLKKLDFTKSTALSADDFQALGYRTKQVLSRIRNPEAMDFTRIVREQGLDETEFKEMTNGQKARLAVLDYAARHPDVGEWSNLAKQLSDPEGAYRFDMYYEQGLLEPINNPDQLLALQQIQEARKRDELMIAEKIGPVFYSELYRDARLELAEGYETQLNEVRANGNPAAAHILNGGVDSFFRMHEGVKEHAVRKSTWGERAFEWTGLAGAGRALTGNAEGVGDWVDLGMTALMFVPGAGWVARAGIHLARKGVARSAMRFGARKVAERVAPKAAFGRVMPATRGLADGRIRAWAEEAATSPERLSGLMSVARRKAAGEAVGAAQAAAVVWRFDDREFLGLNRAAEKVEEAIQVANAMGRAGARDPRMIAMVEEALTEYKSAAVDYYDGGKLPYEVDMMLNLRKMFPRHLISAMDRAGSSHLPPQVRGFSLDEVRAQISGGGRGGVPGGASAAGASAIPLSAVPAISDVFGTQEAAE